LIWSIAGMRSVGLSFKIVKLWYGGVWEGLETVWVGGAGFVWRG